jgi:hypothetical protein
MTFPAASIEPAAAQIPNAHAVIIDETGHMAHIDQPEQWIDAVSEFLAIRAPSPKSAATSVRPHAEPRAWTVVR